MGRLQILVVALVAAAAIGGVAIGRLTASTSVGPTPATAGCPPPPIPSGVYELVVSHDDDPGDFVTGKWTWHAGVADASCLYDGVQIQVQPNGNQGFVELHPYTIREDGAIVFQGMGEPLGVYRVRLVPNGFHLDLVDDPSGGRTIVFPAHDWLRP